MTPFNPSYRGYVYLIGSSKFGWYKIGKSKRVHIRVADIGILLPFKIEVFAIWGTSNETILEAEFHRAFAKYRINGEWFGFERDFFATVIEYGSIYPSTVIYTIGQDLDLCLMANIEKDRDFGDSRAWKNLKSAAWYAAREEWLKEKNLEATKENKKLANMALLRDRSRYLHKLNALQNVGTVII